MLGYPLTPLYGMLFIAVAIYVYYWMLRVLSRPMDRRWMQSHRSIFYLTLLGGMLLVVVLFILGISAAYVTLLFPDLLIMAGVCRPSVLFVTCFDL